MAKIVTLNIVPPEGRKPIGKLAEVPALRPILRKALKKVGTIEWAILAEEPSCNVKSKNKKETRNWHKHFHGIGLVRNRKKTTKLLAKKIGKSKLVHKPVRLDECDGSFLAISYMHKPDSYRRIGYWDKNAKTPSWNTWKSSPALRAKEHVEFLLASDALGFAKRILLYRVKPLQKGNEIMFKISR